MPAKTMDVTTMLVRQRRKFEREKKEALDQQLFKILKSQAKTMEKVLREHREKHESMLEAERLSSSLKMEEMQVQMQRAVDDRRELSQQCKLLSAKLSNLRESSQQQNEKTVENFRVQLERATRRAQGLEEKLKRETSARMQWQVMADEMKTIIKAQQTALTKTSQAAGGAGGAAADAAPAQPQAAGTPSTSAGTITAAELKAKEQAQQQRVQMLEAKHEAELSDLRGQLRESDDERSTLQKRLNDMKQQLDTTVRGQRSKAAEFDALLAAQHNALKQELERVKEHYKAQAAPIVEAAKRSKRQVSAVRKQCDALSSKVRELERLGLQKDQLVHEMSQQLENLDLRNKSLKAEVERGRQALEEQHRTQIATLNAEMSVMHERIELLKDEKQHLERELEDAKKSSSEAAATAPSPPRMKRTNSNLRRRSQVFKSQMERHIEDTTRQLKAQHDDAMALERRRHASQVQELLAQIEDLQNQLNTAHNEQMNASDMEELESFREARAKRTHYLAKGAVDNVFIPMLHRAVKNLSNRTRFIEEFFTTEKTYVEGVQFMCEDYLDHLVALANAHDAGDEKPVMPLSAIYGVFGNIREIFKIHAKFFDAIKVRDCNVLVCFETTIPCCVAVPSCWFSPAGNAGF